MPAAPFQEFNLNGVQGTMHGVAPLMIVNGPYARKIGLHGGNGCFGPGFRANAAIGRAVRLALVNIGASVTNVNVLSGATSVFWRDITFGGNQYTDAIQKELNLPVKFIGVGEQIDDLRPFSAKDFVDALFE